MATSIKQCAIGSHTNGHCYFNIATIPNYFSLNSSMVIFYLRTEKPKEVKTIAAVLVKGSTPE
ncbi:hypothetical protein [Photorhabdus temperata]|uniref:hypothetical protein n=1 Tax=Photorhabdus temperata TaxID=574560 RepID=UPI0004176201|nr:hypothetical protein [Photorhabdus temperata]